MRTFEKTTILLAALLATPHATTPNANAQMVDAASALPPGWWAGDPSKDNPLVATERKPRHP